MKSFTIADVQKKYGVSRRIVAHLVKEGFISPVRGKHREYRFTFNDVVVMRKAYELYAAGIPPGKTARFLKQLNTELSKEINESPASLRISAAGKELVVRDGDGLRNAQGQLVIDFGVADGQNVREFVPARPQPAAEPHKSAADWFKAAASLEASDPVRAVAWYEKAIELDQQYADAYINLTCLLVEGEQYLEAFAVCQEGLVHCPDAALLHFNMGIVHEEMTRISEALKSYKSALALDAAMADAHYNAARLHEQLGQPKAAIRHYGEYHRLKR
jgi:tetratricopeptide (TPR) repeat protein